MYVHKKWIALGILLSISYYSSICYIWPFRVEDFSDMKGLPEINVPGYKGGKVRFTRVGRELFKAFLNQKNYDKTEVNQIIKENAKSKFYHLYSAYCYGLEEWRKTWDPYKKEKIRRTIWNIAIEFANNNISPLKRLLPALLWTGTGVLLVYLLRG